MIGKIYRDIRLWNFLRNLRKKHEKTVDWSRYNLRMDWVGRIYTVLNPELPSDSGDSKEVLKLKYTERIRPINIYLNSLGIGPYVSFAWDEIPESDSYLIAYIPMYEILTFGRIFWFLFLCTFSVVFALFYFF
jgi:hypothetical protein